MSLPTHFPLKIAEGKTIQIPSIGYGTWAAGKPGWCKDATLAALKAGYRHLDCAWSYGVDEEVGAAIRESGIPRSELFITTKFWGHFASPDNIELCLDQCLEKLGLDYVDLYLAHTPLAFKPISRAALENALRGTGISDTDKGIMVDPETQRAIIDWEHTTSNRAIREGKTGSFIPTWEAMKTLVRKNKTRAIGVSNFSATDVEEVLPYAQDITIACNQIEVHPWLPNNELLTFMRKHEILATCFSPFAGQKADGMTLIHDPTVRRVAEKNKMDVGQCLQSWAVQRGTVPLGNSKNEARIASNLAVRRLPSEDMASLDNLEIPNSRGRTIDPSEFIGIKLF